MKWSKAFISRTYYISSALKIFSNYIATLHTECWYWFKHSLFVKKRIGCGLKRDKSPLLEGLFTRALTHTHIFNHLLSKYKVSHVVLLYEYKHHKMCYDIYFLLALIHARLHSPYQGTQRPRVSYFSFGYFVRNIKFWGDIYYYSESKCVQQHLVSVKIFSTIKKIWIFSQLADHQNHKAQGQSV